MSLLVVLVIGGFAFMDFFLFKKLHVFLDVGSFLGLRITVI